MKQLLFIFCLIAAFIACNDDDGSNKDNPTLESPIKELVMPSVTIPFTTGQTVTIQGKGFTTNSEIWLRNVTKAEDDIPTTITNVDDSSISFTVPEKVSGEKQVILKQDGKQYPLGKLNFEVAKNKEEKLFAYKRNYADINNYIKQIVKIDIENGKEQVIATLNFKDTYFETPVFISSTNEIIGLADESLVKVNINTRDLKIIPLGQEEGIDYDGFVGDNNNNLYAYKRNYADMNNYIKQIVKIDIENGKEQVIATLNFKDTYFETPVFISSTNEIIGLADESLVKVNINTGDLKIIPLEQKEDIDYDGFVVDNNNNLFAYKRNYANINNYIKQIVKIDIESGKEQVIATLNFKDTYFETPVFISSTNEIIGLADESLVKVNINTGDLKIIPLEQKENIDYDGLVVAYEQKGIPVQKF